MIEATLNITYQSSNVDLPDTIDYDGTDQQVRQWAIEALAAGGIPGIDAVDRNTVAADLADFVVDRFPARDGLPYRVVLRPKTPLG